MQQILRSVSALLLGAGLMMVGNSLLNITLPLKMDAAEFSAVAVGIIMSAYFAGLFAGALYGKRLIGEVGHIRAFAGFAAIIAAVILAHPMLFNHVSWGILRFLSGFCIAGLFAVLESWLNERSDNATRGQVLSIYMIVNYAAIALGQLMVNLWDLSAQDGFIMAALLVSLSLVPVVVTQIRAPSLENIEPMSIKDLYAASPLAVVGASGAGLLMASYYGIGPLFAEAAGFSVLQVSLFMSSVVVGGLALQWPIGRISDRLDRRTVLLGVLSAVTLTCAVGVAVTALHGQFPYYLLVGVVMGSMTTVYPISVAQAFDYLPRSKYVAASGSLLLAYSVGATAGPILVSLAVGAFGPAAFFGFIGIGAASVGGFAVHRMLVRRPLPPEEQEPIVPVPRMSPVVAAMDPRCPAPEAEAEAEALAMADRAG